MLSCVGGSGAIVSSPAAAYIVAAALTALHNRYIYPLEAYLNFCLGGIGYPCCPIDSTAEAASEAEAVTEAEATLASSDIEKKFRSHSNKRGEGEEEVTRFSLLTFYLATMRRSELVKDSSVGNFH